MTVGNTLFKRRENHLDTYDTSPLKTQADYCLLWTDHRKLLIDLKALPSEEHITQHKSLV